MDEFLRKFSKLWETSLPFTITTTFAISGALVLLAMAYQKLNPG